jgi:hypothetical protein
VLPNGAADVLALWTEHTYAVDAAQITPRLAIVSPQPRCGKTTLMALLGMGVCRPLQSSNISTAGLFRAIEQWQPTLLIDEGDTFLKDNEEFRGVLNAGHFRPNAYVVRAVPSGDSWVAQKFGIWGPVAIALIGRLPSTLGDRSITIRLRRKTPLEQVQRLRLDKPGNVEELRQRCRRWAQDHLSALTACDPSVPEMVNDRAADNWRCLCSIAEVAGGEWPERVQKAMKLLAIDDTDDDAVSAMLLADIREIFAEKRVEKISSDELTTALHGLEERPWSEWGRQGKPITTRQLAGLLRPFDIRSRNVKVSARSPKGYHSDDFTDAWSRYLSPIPPSSQEGDLSATPLPASNGTGVQPFSSATHSDVRSATPLPCNNGKENCVSHPLPANTDTAVADQNTFIPASILDGSAVADRTQISVADENALRPASILDGSAVADKSPGKEEGG